MSRSKRGGRGAGSSAPEEREGRGSAGRVKSDERETRPGSAGRASGGLRGPDDELCEALEGEIVGKEGDDTLQPITIEVDRQLERLEEVLEKVAEEVRHWAKKGVHNKVRFKLRGKQILPDIPMAAFIAAEAATFWWGGLLRALAVNLGGRAILDVELVSDAEPHLARGKEHLLDGDLEEALECFETAITINRDLPSAHLNLGVVRKLQGDKAAARASFERARKLDPHGEIGRQAWSQLNKM